MAAHSHSHARWLADSLAHRMLAGYTHTHGHGHGHTEPSRAEQSSAAAAQHPRLSARCCCRCCWWFMYKMAKGKNKIIQNTLTATATASCEHSALTQPDLIPIVSCFLRGGGTAKPPCSCFCFGPRPGPGPGPGPLYYIVTYIPSLMLPSLLYIFIYTSRLLLPAFGLSGSFFRVTHRMSGCWTRMTHFHSELSGLWMKWLLMAKSYGSFKKSEKDL